jgi:hypothetical protein
MADSNFRGPINSIGALEDTNATTGTTSLMQISPLDGPSGFYQNVAWLDPRAVPFAKDGFRPGQVPAFVELSDCYTVDNIPQTASTTTLAAAQTLTAGTPITLVSAQVVLATANNPFLAIGVPVVPQGTTVATTAIAVDFGFTSGTFTANSSTVNVADNTQLQVGQWIIGGGVGNSGGSVSLITQVLTISTANITGITIGPNLPGTTLHAPIGAGNLFGGAFLPPTASFGPTASSANGHDPHLQAGLLRVFNPREGITRNMSVTAGTTTATTAVTVNGLDIWGQRMSETITVPSGNRLASSFYGAKAFKYITSGSVSTTAGGTASLGIGDTFGMPLRADRWEQTQIFWAGNNVATQTGFIAAFTTTPMTATTADVRGTVQIGTGAGTAIQSTSASNGTSRLVILQNPGVWNTVTATPNNLPPMFGFTQG